MLNPAKKYQINYHLKTEMELGIHFNTRRTKSKRIKYLLVEKGLGAPYVHGSPYTLHCVMSLYERVRKAVQ